MSLTNTGEGFTPLGGTTVWVCRHRSLSISSSRSLSSMIGVAAARGTGSIRTAVASASPDASSVLARSAGQLVSRLMNNRTAPSDTPATAGTGTGSRIRSCPCLPRTRAGSPIVPSAAGHRSRGARCTPARGSPAGRWHARGSSRRSPQGGCGAACATAGGPAAADEPAHRVGPRAPHRAVADGVLAGPPPDRD